MYIFEQSPGVATGVLSGKTRLLISVLGTVCAHTYLKSCINMDANIRIFCTANIQPCESLLPNKAARSSVDDGPIPHFVATVTSLHSGKFGGFFTQRPRLFPHKSVHCVSRWWKTHSCDLRAS